MLINNNQKKEKTQMKNKTLASLLVTTAIATMAGTATAQTANSGAWGVKNPLFDTVAGKLNLTANVGYVYNFDSKWDSEIGTGKANGGFGYGARLGYTNSSGFGLSGDYLGFTSKWSSGGMEYTNPYHILTVTPSYRFSFGQTKEWGLKVGLGVGMSLADVSWGTAKTAKGASGKVAGGAAYTTTTFNQITGSASVCPATSGVIDVYSDSLTGTSAGGTVSLGASKCLRGLGGAAQPQTSNVDDTGIALAIKEGKLTWINNKVAGNVWSAAVSTTDATEAQKVIDALKGAATASGTSNFESKAGATISTVFTTALNSAITAATTGSNDHTALTNLKKNLAEASKAAPAADSAGGSGGSAKDDAGFVLAPEVALEYDNGLLHADINARYIHGLANVKYDGQNGTGNQLQRSGPLAVFVGAGFGVNF